MTRPALPLIPPIQPPAQNGSSTPTNTGKYDVEFRLYEAYRNKINHEDDLLHQRTTSLTQIQGLLLGIASAGYWIIVKSDPIKDRQSILDVKSIISIIGLIGMAFAISYFFPIRSAVNSIKGLEKSWSDIFDESMLDASGRNQEPYENKLDQFIMRDLPRLTNNVSEPGLPISNKHKIRKLSASIGGWCSMAAPIFCMIFWILIVYNNSGGFPFTINFIDGAMVIRPR